MIQLLKFMTLLGVFAHEPAHSELDFSGEGLNDDLIFRGGFEALGITMRSDSIRNYDHLDFLYAWHEDLVRMYGDRPRLVAEGVNPRVPASSEVFTGGRAGDSFGFRLSGFADWDSDDALSALADGQFEVYLESRLDAEFGVKIDRHADLDGLKLGFGVNSSTIQVDTGDGVNRTDRVSQPGEALMLVIDTDGTYQPDPNLPGNTHYEFVPEDEPLQNSGLHPETHLLLSEIHLEPVNVNPNNITCSVDYFIYDVSAGTLMSGISGQAGLGIGVELASLDKIGTLPGTWQLDDGDIIILAYNKDTVVFNDNGGTYKHSWGLWSMKWDLKNN